MTRENKKVNLILPLPLESDKIIDMFSESEHQKLLPQTARKILALNKPDQQLLIGFVDKFRLGINYSREFIGYILDISRRDGTAISEFLQDKKIRILADSPNLPHARKMELLREVLRRRRFPLSPHPLYPPLPEGEGETPDLSGEGMRVKPITFAKQKGTWLKRCPGTLGHICCNYLVINSISGCPFDCTYCYLNTYLNKPGIAVFTNFDDLMGELESFLAENRGSHFRIGTGEFSDSLALDKEQNLAGKLIEFFARQNEHLLELKTKSDKVDHLLALDHRGRTVFAWSVNPEKIVRSEELGTVSLAERIAAAEKGVNAGYPVAFHFDPIIFYAGWDKDYKQVIDFIFSKIDSKNIAWISLGALRYQPELKDIVEERFPYSRITLGELDAGEDGKMRYFKPIRIEIFKKMHNFIRSYSKEVYVYLCMESADIWQASGLKNQPANPYADYFKFFRV